MWWPRSRRKMALQIRRFCKGVATTRVTGAGDRSGFQIFPIRYWLITSAGDKQTELFIYEIIVYRRISTEVPPPPPPPPSLRGPQTTGRLSAVHVLCMSAIGRDDDHGGRVFIARLPRASTESIVKNRMLISGGGEALRQSPPSPSTVPPSLKINRRRNDADLFTGLSIFAAAAEIPICVGHQFSREKKKEKTFRGGKNLYIYI